jgi:predicted MPP superfamily phosphohydrolase
MSMARAAEDLFFVGDWPARVSRFLGLQSRLRVREHRVTVAAPGSSGSPLRIAFGADFHAGPLTDRGFLLECCRKLADARADVLLLGGDFIDLTVKRAGWLAQRFADIPAPSGKFAVLGNHDWWSEPVVIRRALEEAGIEVLTNRNVRLPSPFDWAWICGLDDHLAGAHDPDSAFSGADGCRVVLMHSPSNLLEIGERRFDLALCGHTHGGQIALPGGIPLVMPEGRLSRKYARGRFELPHGATMIVSTGIGFTGLPLRLFADAEILICEVHPTGEPAG